MIFDTRLDYLIRPFVVAMRGAVITMLALLVFCNSSGIDRMQHPRPYFGGIGLAFIIHYLHAWSTVRTYRQHRNDHERDTNAKGERRPDDVIGNAT